MDGVTTILIGALALASPMASPMALEPGDGLVLQQRDCLPCVELSQPVAIERSSALEVDWPALEQPRTAPDGPDRLLSTSLYFTDRWLNLPLGSGLVLLSAIFPEWDAWSFDPGRPELRGAIIARLGFGAQW